MVAMAATAQVQYERRVRLRYAIIAFAAAVLIVGSQVVDLGGQHANVDELTLELVTAHQRATLDVVGAVLDMLGLIGVGVTLAWLHRISVARNPELNQVVKWLAVIGSGLAAVMVIAYELVLAGKAHDFVTSGNQGYPEADHLMSTGAVVILPLLLYLGLLLLALGCIWTSLRAMRVGLITRVTGYAGVVAGALFLFQIAGLQPIVQGFWLAAVAVTMAARWPSGDPPAWEAGEAIPWTPLGNPPKRADLPKREPLFGRRNRTTTRDVVEQTTRPVPTPRAGTPKRKRKRRN